MTFTSLVAIIAPLATWLSVMMILFSTRANNQRKKKELTLQYTNSHELNTEGLLREIKGQRADP